MSRAPRPRKQQLDPLFESILSAPDRDRCPLVDPVVSFAETDEAGYLRSIETAVERTVALERRGAYHGEWAVLDAEALPRALRSPADAFSNDEIFSAIHARWHDCKPIVLPSIAADVVDDFAAEIAERDALREDLSTAGGLRQFVTARTAEIEPAFELLAKRAKLADPERDIERVLLASFPPTGRGKRIEDLWLKSAWLSTHDDDASMRLRFSFGSERDDDASRDIVRQRVTADLAERLLPESAALSAHPALAPLLDKLCGESVLFTQHIAYWNSKSGGALFHHDAFAEDAFDDGTWRQLGVCYVQLSGATAWLALAIDDLAARCAEFVEALAEGALPWVRAQLCGGGRPPIPGGFERLWQLAQDRAACTAELALPGQGALGALVNRGPEFTSFLADAGHGFVLEAGDAILLPNRGLHATCMHSVFCASEETGYSLSLALRPNREAPEDTEARSRDRRSARSRDVS
ncbi:MAG: hypothetical protein JNL28_01470 [Planctomycetes bacterium]|nr:hypothetical protein [Planctomycetota bacterium]